jgi:type IV pilus assembly protein PilV
MGGIMPMSLSLSFPRLQAGMSLLEVLITTLVLSVGLLGLAGLQIAGMKTTHNSYQMQQATWMVHDLLERMRTNKTGAYAGNYNSPVPPAPPFTCGATPTCAIATACTPVETAAIDLNQVQCGTGGSGGVQNELMGATLTVACVAAGCREGVNINLRWNERNATRAAKDLDGGTDGIDGFNIQLNAIL